MAVVRIPVMVEVEVDPSTGKPALPEQIDLLGVKDGAQVTVQLQEAVPGRALLVEGAAPSGTPWLPLVHALTHATTGTDPVSPGSIGAATAAALVAHAALTTTAHGGVLPATAFVGLAKITVAPAAPVGPAAGDLWVDTT